jgi:cell division protein ZapE
MNLKQSYDLLVSEGKIKQDAAQLLVFEKLRALADQLNAQAVPRNRLTGLFKPRQSVPRGLYIYGEVGRGKTMLMDLFFASVKNGSKHRQHFHAFMQDIHAKRATQKSDNIISEIANEIAANAKLLCLDEMQISDIADAMIIGRLFEALEQRGVCFVTTSNLAPDQLYRDGLNRQLFLPFIAKLNSALDVVCLANGTDYRLGRMASRKTYLTPLGKKTVAEIEAIWNDLTDNSEGKAQDIDILGRKLHVPRSAHSCARFTFGELCEQPLAAPDYLALAKTFRTVIIENIPILKATQRNETKRFILMIDTFYDMKTRVIISAQAPAPTLCITGQYKFEFQRIASRLQEMQSTDWWRS